MKGYWYSFTRITEDIHLIWKLYIGGQANTRHSAELLQFHQRAHWNGPNIQSTKLQDLNRKVLVEFLEFKANGALSRSQYLTPFSVKRRLITTLLTLVAFPKLVMLLKVITLLIRIRNPGSLLGPRPTVEQNYMNAAEQSGYCLRADVTSAFMKRLQRWAQDSQNPENCQPELRNTPILKVVEMIISSTSG